MGAIRGLLAVYTTRHGASGSTRLAATRAHQARDAAPTHRALAAVIASRLAAFPDDEGVPDLMPVLAPVSAQEAARWGVPADQAVPEALVAKVRRCREAPIEALVSEGLVASAESMARLLPALAGRVRAAAIADPALQRLWAATYLAFRRRRSLLLVDLSSQVKLGELPWISAVAPWVGTDQATRDAARATLVHASTLALRAFPQTLVPNTLVRELRALAAGAELSLPLVNEVAADIFMGAFSATFLRAAHVAAARLRGSLYERYYGLPFDRVATLDDVVPAKRGTPTSPGFFALCAELSGLAPGGRRSVARNGAILEQAQLLTMHNLAVLIDGLDLAGALPLPDLVRACFTWICRTLQRGGSGWRAQLHAIKNSAYAWRQMMFFLSLMTDADISALMDWSAAHLRDQPEAFQRRFAPAFAGLRAAVGGERFDADGIHTRSGGRRFLGWTEGRHWLSPSEGAPR